MEKLTIKLYDIDNRNLLSVYKDDEIPMEVGEYTTITYTNPKKKYKLKGSFRVMWASEVANNEQTVLVQIDQTTKYLEINTQYCKLLQSIKKNAENIIESMNETENMEEALTHIKKGYDIIKKECDMLNL